MSCTSLVPRPHPLTGRRARGGHETRVAQLQFTDYARDRRVTKGLSPDPANFFAADERDSALLKVSKTYCTCSFMCTICVVVCYQYDGLASTA